MTHDTVTVTNDARPSETEADAKPLAEHVCGAHLLQLAGMPGATRLHELLGDDDLARVVTDWHRTDLMRGRDIPDSRTGKPAADPFADEILAIPTALVREWLADRGIPIPTREECRAWAAADLAAGGDGIDPERELLRARYGDDPDLAMHAAPAERRIGGVPESIFDLLSADEQAQVRAGKVIPSPHAPAAVARWLIRSEFTVRVPCKGRRTAVVRTLRRVDQTWYHYAAPAAGEPPRWIARTDPEWMPARLHEALDGRRYVKIKDLTTGPEFMLRAWNTTRTNRAEVEAALHAELHDNSGAGVTARELPDAYGRVRSLYPQGGVLCRNGILDPATGKLRPNTPLWFSPTMLDAAYDHTVDPYAATEWLRMLRDQWADDPGAIACLQQWFGYIVSGRTDLHKWMLIVGPPASGKSIIARVLGALAGQSDATSLDTLNSPFGLQALYEGGAALAVLPDIRFTARDSSQAVGNLLGIVGEDTMTVARKYKTSVSAALPARFHGSANELPRLQDNSTAVQRRTLILETRASFAGREDPGLARRITAHELGAVLRWAVEGLAALNAAGGVFTRSAGADEAAADMGDLSSAVRTFIGECCELGSAEEFVDLRDLFRVWRAWADESNTGQGMSQGRFRTALKALYLDPVRPGQKKVPDGGAGKWLVVWGVKRASHTSAYGAITSTDGVGDPLYGLGERRG